MTSLRRQFGYAFRCIVWRTSGKSEDPTASLNNVILGLVKGKDLKHWVYKKDNNCVYNWGVKKTLAEVMKECSSFSDGVAYQIAGL